MKTILVVDDSASVRQQLCLSLQPAGYIVMEATDGVDGAQKIASNPQISLVICDINMPRMNGLEMLEKIRTDPRTATLPVVMLTTEGQQELIQRAKKAGAKGWIVKPFKAELLISAIQKLTA
jgi:two-component system, chemotaxis family, chemotaxis protein CheY